MKINNLPKRLLLTLWGIVLGASLLSAQNKTVKGVVLDETDQGVIGAAVMIKGTTWNWIPRSWMMSWSSVTVPPVRRTSPVPWTS